MYVHSIYFFVFLLRKWYQDNFKWQVVGFSKWNVSAYLRWNIWMSPDWRDATTSNFMNSYWHDEIMEIIKIIKFLVQLTISPNDGIVHIERNARFHRRCIKFILLSRIIQYYHCPYDWCIEKTALCQIIASIFITVLGIGKNCVYT